MNSSAESDLHLICCELTGRMDEQSVLSLCPDVTHNVAYEAMRERWLITQTDHRHYRNVQAVVDERDDA